MIPKVINYCWFGGKAIPPEFMKNIESWKKYLPDHQIVRWDESNFDVHCNRYADGAYRAKNYAYLSDYARFAILNQTGGIYFDTDVEVLRPLDDILAAGPFMGEEKQGEVAAGLGMAMEPGMDFLREMVELYDGLTYSIVDENEKSVTVVQRVTRLLNRHGYDPRKKTIQTVCGINIYPREYFCPQDYRTGEITITENTRTIHHYSASWMSPLERRMRQYVISVRKKRGQTRYVRFLEKVLHYRRRMAEKTFSGMVKTVFRKVFRIPKKQ